MEQSPTIKDITFMYSDSIKKNFINNGDRTRVFFEGFDEIELNENTKISDAVLTLIDKSKDKSKDIYSFSIKFDTDTDIILNIEQLKQKFVNVIIYDITQNQFITTTTNDDIVASHMLFIGTVNNNTFTITKTILITSHNDVYQIEKDAVKVSIEVSIEEYLNLYYIDYFSFMYEKFESKYKSFITNKGEGNEGEDEEDGGETETEGEEEAGAAASGAAEKLAAKKAPTAEAPAASGAAASGAREAGAPAAPAAKEAKEKLVAKKAPTAEAAAAKTAAAAARQRLAERLAARPLIPLPVTTAVTTAAPAAPAAKEAKQVAK